MDQEFALKEMSKATCARELPSIQTELSLLKNLKSEFIVNLHYAFQDEGKLFQVFDYMPGGDLRYQMKQNRFSMDHTRFFVACLVQALEDVHAHNVIHKDIKPENLIFDRQGYLRLTDFGLAREIKPRNSRNDAGTFGYMAPEVVTKQDHGKASDIFAVGAIVYLFMRNKLPYEGHRGRDHYRLQVQSFQRTIDTVPEGWSQEAVDFVNSCIKNDPKERLGSGKDGINELKEHNWFEGFDWDELKSRQMRPSFFPNNVLDNFDAAKVAQKTV